MNEATFRVDGVPIPQGSKTIAKAGKKVWLRDANAAKLKPWRERVSAAAAAIGYTFDCPVKVEACFYLPRPKTVNRDLPSVKPDLDKLARALGDGITSGGLVIDDSRIVTLNADKRYADDDNAVGVVVTVQTMEGDQ